MIDINCVLMDTRHHRTIRLGLWSSEVQVPVEPRPRGIGWAPDFIPFIVETAIFRFSGDKLYGDPIFYQVSGPTLPDSWWRR